MEFKSKEQKTDEFDKALHASRVYRDIAFCDLGSINADMVALVADALIRLSEAQWSFVLGRDDDHFFFSIRAKKRSYDVSQTGRRLVPNLGMACEHRIAAGGIISVGRLSPEKIEGIHDTLRERFFRIVGREDADGEGLL